MIETLLTKAEANYNIAVMIYKQMTGDEIYLNYVGYNLQQATEILIKYQIELSGHTPRKTHDIRMLLQFARANEIDLVLDPFIVTHADSITMWESQTRYILNYRVELDLINQGLKAIGATLKKLKNLESDTGTSLNNMSSMDAF